MKINKLKRSLKSNKILSNKPNLKRNKKKSQRRNQRRNQKRNQKRKKDGFSAGAKVSQQM